MKPYEMNYDDLSSLVDIVLAVGAAYRLGQGKGNDIDKSILMDSIGSQAVCELLAGSSLWDWNILNAFRQRHTVKPTSGKRAKKGGVK